MLESPIVVFMEPGYNVYILQRAARRSSRIGQKQAVIVFFLGYAGSAQMRCLELMAKKNLGQPCAIELHPLLLRTQPAPISTLPTNTR